VLFAAGKKDKTDTGFQEKNGIRCVRLNPSGTHVASGDRAGNVRCESFCGIISTLLCINISSVSAHGIELSSIPSVSRSTNTFTTNTAYYA